MGSSLTFAILTITVVATFVFALPQKYSTKYDNVDIDSILKNDRLLGSHVNCLLDRGPCTKEGQDFKDYLPEAIDTSCEKCTVAQKRIVKKAAKYLMENKKPEWEEIRSKYDPNEEHVEEFNKFMEEPVE